VDASSRNTPSTSFYVWDDEREEVVDAGNVIPAAWDRRASSLPDGGVDAVVEAGFAEGVPTPSVLCALQILISPDCRGQGRWSATWSGVARTARISIPG
jgi:hypothetical protein